MQFTKRASEKSYPPIYQSYKIIVEWNSLCKKKDLKFLSAYDLNDFGEFKFNSFFNKDIFKTEENEMKQKSKKRIIEDEKNYSS